ncbi:OsmC family protein [Wenzhouxiangella sp. AB-CW3]|uniref:OsmC family protein n=1 Tax=Wenzhouxiangella sp. AB-CW3 TaxID=2771012 RepID=UPI00168AA263|nr:OsmC family protein [Wenzhouxiangella sp. AB-CW3]QOC23950.1 OsmC family protein [Wenzhouxiangella sp. AB-CW3]
MSARKSSAQWQGDLKSGKGTMTLGDGAWKGQYSFSSRFEEGQGTNPEELIAAAHAGCFSMALSNILAGAGHTPDSVQTEATVHLEKGDEGPSITRIELDCEAVVPGIGEDEFNQHAEAASKGCPVSRVLAGASISLKARLKS